MKKYLSLLMLLGLSLISIRVQASSVTIVKGLEWELQDETNIQFNFVYDGITDTLYVKPNNTLYDSSLLSNGIMLNTPSLTESALLELGVDIQSQTPFVTYTEKIGFTYYLNGGSTIIQSQFEYLAIETENGTYYHKINLGIGQGLKIDFDLEYQLTEDGGVNSVSDTITTEFYINDVLFPYVTADLSDWSHARVYLFNPAPVSQSLFLEQGNYRYWYGFSQDTFKSGFYFTENYFLKYVEDYIDPYDNGDTVIRDSLINSYVAKVKTEGITLTLPANNQSLYLFSPAWYLDSIEPWFLINGQFNSVNIRIPDLAYDPAGPEIWGDTLIYTVGANSYTFNLVDEFNQTIPPIFGVRVAKDFYEISFDSNGGSAVTSIYAGIGQVVQAPPIPTRTGYEFLGWTLNDIASDQPYDSIYAEVNQFPLRQNFPFEFEGLCLDEDKDLCTSGLYNAQDIEYQAVWRKTPVFIYLVLNGGERRPIFNFNNNVVVVEYGNTANTNFYSIPLNNSVYRLGYAFLGWYIDEELTTPFNLNAPLTANLTVYARWEAGITGGESPTILNQVMELLGLFNHAGFILLYFIILIVLFIVLSIIRVPDIILAVVLLSLTALWGVLGWLTPVAVILMILFIALIILLTLRWRS